MLTPDELQERIQKGWIKSKMWFEVLALDKKITEDALKGHVEKIKREKDTIVLGDKFEEIKYVENPLERVKDAFSQAVEIDLMTKNIETLLTVVIFYGPSAVEIIQPDKLTIGMQSVQAIMNSVADLIHRIAARGAGGIVISAKK